MKVLPLTLLLLAGISALLVSCGEDSRQARGFRLPEGDIEAGKAAFVALKCTQCHSVDGIQLDGLAPGQGFTLGGEVRKVKTYGELVTSVIDPKRHVSPKFVATHPPKEGEEPKSPMPSYNSDMTVTQLTDIVAFLHSRYRETGPEFPDYPLMP